MRSSRTAPLQFLLRFLACVASLLVPCLAAGQTLAWDHSGSIPADYYELVTDSQIVRVGLNTTAPIPAGTKALHVRACNAVGCGASLPLSLVTASPTPTPPPVCVVDFRIVTVPSSGSNTAWGNVIAAEKAKGYEPALAITATRAVFRKSCP